MGTILFYEVSTKLREKNFFGRSKRRVGLHHTCYCVQPHPPIAKPLPPFIRNKSPTVSARDLSALYNNFGSKEERSYTICIPLNFMLKFHQHFELIHGTSLCVFVLSGVYISLTFTRRLSVVYVTNLQVQ